MTIYPCFVTLAPVCRTAPLLPLPVAVVAAVPWVRVIIILSGGGKVPGTPPEILLLTIYPIWGSGKTYFCVSLSEPVVLCVVLCGCVLVRSQGLESDSSSESEEDTLRRLRFRRRLRERGLLPPHGGDIGILI
jgi:hypothetical protein